MPTGTVFDWASVWSMVQAVSIVVAIVGCYWRIRELIFKLHAENRERLAKQDSQFDAIEDRFETMNGRIEKLTAWWERYLERRTDVRP